MVQATDGRIWVTPAEDLTMLVKPVRFIVLDVAITAAIIAIGHAISYVFG